MHYDGDAMFRPIHSYRPFFHTYVKTAARAKTPPAILHLFSGWQSREIWPRDCRLEHDIKIPVQIAFPQHQYYAPCHRALVVES